MLQKSASFKAIQGPVVTVVLDGFGITEREVERVVNDEIRKLSIIDRSEQLDGCRVHAKAPGLRSGVYLGAIHVPAVFIPIRR